MAQLMRAGFVVHYDLKWLGLGDKLIKLVGHIFCLGKIIIRVSKELESQSLGLDPIVLPFLYEYNANVYQQGDILRYDNTHELTEDCGDYYHRHTFKWPPSRGDSKGCSESVPANQWPYLDEFVYMVAEIYYEHEEELGKDPATKSMLRPQ